MTSQIIVSSLTLIWIVGVYGDRFEAFNVKQYNGEDVETFICEELDIGIGVDPLVNIDIDTTYRCESDTEVCYLQNGELVYCKRKV